MESDFTRHMRVRIKHALTKDQEYKHLQIGLVIACKCKDYEQQEEILNKLDIVAKELCYIQGYKDAMGMIVNLNQGVD